MFGKLIQHYRDSFTGLSKPIWMLALVLFVNRSGSMVIFFLTLYLTKRLEFSIALAGKMMSVYGLGALAGSYLGGWLSDKIGYSRVQLLSLFLTGLAYITVIFWKSTLLIAINLFILAVVAEAFRPATTTAFAKQTIKKLRSRAFAVQRLAVNLGVAIGPALGGFIASYNYTYLFWIDGITCIIAGIIHYFFIHRKLSPHKEKTNRADKIVATFIKDKLFIILLIFAFLLGTAFMQLLSTWPVYLKQIVLLGEGQIGLLLAINTILIVVFEIPLIHYLEKFRTVRIMAVGALLLCIGFGILPLGSSYFYIGITVIIWTFGEILIFPNLAAFISSRASDSNLGMYMGMYSFSFSLAFAVAPAMGSYIYSAFGPSTLWFGIGLLGIMIGTGFLFTAKIIDTREY